MRIWVLCICLIADVGMVISHQQILSVRMLRADAARVPQASAVAAFAVVQGESLYAMRCAACHGPRGRGDSRRGVPSLVDDDWLYGDGSVDDIEQIVTYGIRSHHAKTANFALMPAYATAHPHPTNAAIPSLSAGQIGDLAEFLLYSQGIRAGDAAVSRGAQLYQGKAGCYDCHGGDLKGDAAIGAPNLTDRITLYGDGSRQSLIASISDGRQGVCPAWSGRMSAAAIREVAFYVHSIVGIR